MKVINPTKKISICPVDVSDAFEQKTHEIIHSTNPSYNGLWGYISNNIFWFPYLDEQDMKNICIIFDLNLNQFMYTSSDEYKPINDGIWGIPMMYITIQK